MRERLIELLDAYGGDISFCDICDRPTEDCEACKNEQLADFLLANGVIVPPCKVGDTMYKLCSVNSNIKMGQMWDGKIVKTNCDRCGYKNCACYDIGLREQDKDCFIDVIEGRTIRSLEFLIKIMPYIGTVWFTSKEEAEAALKGDNDLLR